MEILTITYNVILLILFSVILTLTALYYHQSHKKMFLIASIFFIIYIMDDLIIFMTEMIEWFSKLYDSRFMYVPTYKTLIYVAVSLCMIEINAYLLIIKQKSKFYIGLALLTIVLLCVPMMSNSAFKVWLYYTPNQVFTLALSIYSIIYITKNRDMYDPAFFKRYRNLLICFAVFSVLIAIEDTIVIFNFDTYSDVFVKINNRSISEDIMHIIFSVYGIRVLLHTLECNQAEIHARSAIGVQEVSASPIAVTGETDQDRYVKFFKFCKCYQLTTREQDILTLLLENKNNQEISDELLISVGTTKTHTHNIFQKIGVAKRAQLLAIYNDYSPE